MRDRFTLKSDILTLFKRFGADLADLPTEGNDKCEGLYRREREDGSALALIRTNATDEKSQATHYIGKLPSTAPWSSTKLREHKAAPDFASSKRADCLQKVSLKNFDIIHPSKLSLNTSWEDNLKEAIALPGEKPLSRRDLCVRDLLMSEHSEVALAAMKAHIASGMNEKVVLSQAAVNVLVLYVSRSLGTRPSRSAPRRRLTPTASSQQFALHGYSKAQRDAAQQDVKKLI